MGAEPPEPSDPPSGLPEPPPGPAPEPPSGVTEPSPGLPEPPPGPPADVPPDPGPAERPDAAGPPPPPKAKAKVTSSRVTPKGGGTGPGAKSRNPAVRAAAESRSSSGRYTPPADRAQQLPSPWWVPALMFGLIISGALVIVLNYLGALGDVDNLKLVIGLVLILGGIIAATQYR